MRFKSSVSHLLTLVTLFLVSSAGAQPTYTLTEPSLGGRWGTAVGLNEAGQVTGGSQDAQGNGQAFVYDARDGIRPLALGVHLGYAMGRNETGRQVRAL